LTEEAVSQDEIEKVDIENAVNLIEYFKDHWLGASRYFEFDKEDRKIEDFVAWVEKEGGSLTYQQIRNAGRWGKARTKILEFLTKVQDRGLGQILPTDNATGRKGIRFVLTPKEEAHAA
jgi:hypothetical protein